MITNNHDPHRHQGPVDPREFNTIYT